MLLSYSTPSDAVLPHYEYKYYSEKSQLERSNLTAYDISNLLFVLDLIVYVVEEKSKHIVGIRVCNN